MNHLKFWGGSFFLWGTWLLGKIKARKAGRWFPNEDGVVCVCKSYMSAMVQSL